MPEFDPALELRERSVAAAFASIGAFLLAALYWLARVGFENPLYPIAVTLGIALFIICAPLAAWVALAQRAAPGELAWWRSHAFLSIAAIALTALAGMSADVAGRPAAIVILVAGIASFAWVSLRWIAAVGIRRAIVLKLLALVLFAWAGGVAWSSRHKHPLLMEELYNRANVHQDPLFNSAMANMMQVYGVPSTGIDGVPYIPYHYGASWLYAQWADLAGLDVLSFYNLGPTVVLVPVFVCALLLLVVEARSAMRRRGRPPAMPLERDYLAAGALLVATVGIFPSAALTAIGTWNTHVLISESYTTGLAVFLFGAALLLVFHDSRAATAKSMSTSVFALLVLPLLLTILGFLKVSLMFLTLGAVIWTVIRTGLWRRPLILASVALSGVIALVTLGVVSLPSQNQGLMPLAYMRGSIPIAWWFWFPFVHLFWSLLYVIARVREEGVRTVGELGTQLGRQTLFDAELVAAIAIAGFLPGLILQIHGGSAFYFSDVQRWVALPLVLAMASRWTIRGGAAPELKQRGGISGWRLRHVAFALLALPLGITALRNVTRAAESAVRQNVTLRRELYTLAGVTETVPVHQLRNPSVLREGLNGAPNFALVSALRGLSEMPRAAKRVTALFVPQSATSFWSFFPESERCSVAPLAGPAISGLALIDGMPPASCPFTDQYAFGLYEPRGAPQAGGMTVRRLCERAVSKGFKRLIMLGPAPDYSSTTVYCVEGAPRYVDRRSMWTSVGPDIRTSAMAHVTGIHGNFRKSM